MFIIVCALIWFCERHVKGMKNEQATVENIRVEVCFGLFWFALLSVLRTLCVFYMRMRLDFVLFSLSRITSFHELLQFFLDQQ